MGSHHPPHRVRFTSAPLRPAARRATVCCVIIATLAASCRGSVQLDEDATPPVPTSIEEPAAAGIATTTDLASDTASLTDGPISSTGDEAFGTVSSTPAGGESAVSQTVHRADRSTSVSQLLPGEPVDGPLPFAGPLAVVGVEAGDVLNVRVRPGADQDVVETVGPLTTDLGMTGRARVLTDPRAMWVEIETDETIGWVHGRFVAPLAGTIDITADVRAANGGSVTGATIEAIGDQVVAIRSAGADPRPSAAVVDGPTAVGPAEITYDLIGFGDDSVWGERLHLVVGTTGDGTGRLELQAAEATFICIRGSGGGSGLCP